jgi:MarR family 2-MHQ and catechol resistance regulon transcriptional repressor
VLLTSGSMTAAVDRLERRGLVRRDDDPNDRRARLVRLTPDGKKLIRGMFSSHEQMMESAVAGLTAKERATLLGLLRKLGRGAEEFAAPESRPSKPGRKSGRAAWNVRESKRRRQ